MANMAQAPQQLQQIQNYGAQQASIKQKLALAEAIRRGLEQARTPEMQVVGGRVIKNNPLAGALAGITGAIGNYEGNQGIEEQGALEDQKRQALVSAINGGNLDVEALAKSGVDPEQISKFAITQQLQRSRPETWHQMSDDKGNMFMQSDRGNIRRSFNVETGQLMDFKSPLYDPQAVYERSQAKGALDSFKTKDEENRDIIVTAGQANPTAYGKYSLPQQNMQQQMAQPQQQQPAQQPMPDNQPQQMAQPEPDEQFKRDIFLRAVEDVKGPGSSKDLFSGGRFYPEPEEDAAITERYNYYLQHPELVNSGSNMLNSGSQGTAQGTQQGIRGMSQADKDALELKKNLAQREGEIALKSLEPLPPKVLEQRVELLDEIALNSSISSDLGALKNQIESGSLNLGFLSNIINNAGAFLGSNDPEVANYSSFLATLEKLRNDSLRLNKGTQTETDAVRAWDELVKNIRSKKSVSQRLEEIQNLNERAAETKKNLVNSMQENYGKPAYDFSQYENNKQPVVGGKNPGQQIRKVIDNKTYVSDDGVKWYEE